MNNRPVSSRDVNGLEGNDRTSCGGGGGTANKIYCDMMFAIDQLDCSFIAGDNDNVYKACLAQARARRDECYRTGSYPGKY